MKILFVTPQVPWPPSQGTALRNLHLLKAAAERHEADLLSFDDGMMDGGRGPLPDLCGRIETVPLPPRPRIGRLLDLTLGRADMERRLWSPEFDARLHRMLADTAYDVVQLEGFEVAGYLLGPAALRRELYERTVAGSERGADGPKIIFDDHNAEYELQRSAARIDAGEPRRWLRAVYSAVQARRLRVREALYCAAADLTFAVSDDDAAALEAIVPGLGAVVVPNGVDCAALPAPVPAPALFFAGKLDYRPNVDACEWLVRDILPLVRAHVPNARVVLAGRDPSPAVRALAGPNVEVTGALSDAELARRRAEAWVYVVPMRMGSGVRFKVLEAMAAGIPLVSTPLGAAGSGAEHGRHALIAADAGTFAAAVVELLQSPDRRVSLAASARKIAETCHDWRHITPRLFAAYDMLQADPRLQVSAIATVLNERETAGALVEALAAQSRPPGEVVVVDGGSTDGTWEVLSEYSGRPQSTRSPRPGPLPKGGETTVRALCVPGTTISRGRNRAIAEATHETIAATDAGVTLHPAWLARLVAPLERDPRLEAASGFFVAAPQTTWELALGATTLPSVEEIDPRRFLPSSRSIAFRRRAWHVAGGYPEWLDYCEDLLFDVALLANDVRPRFVPRAFVRFRPRSSPRAFFWQYYRYARGDGKADLWRRRHAIRYGSYLCGLVLAARALGALGAQRVDPAAAALLLAGSATYLCRPLQRLAHQSRSPAELCRAAPLVAVVRLIGDVAKMAGYPVGVLWRLRHRPPAGALRPPETLRLD
ncbi:MAG: glycosyltransferase [Chloroflexi bacterium]|nr:glycosyltransferase [Chloroflexota bacterium]